MYSTKLVIQKADIFSFLGKADCICITTNGYITKSGLAVMGRGNAKEAANRFPILPKILAQKIKENGNVVNLLLKVGGTWVVSFPVKPSVINNPSVEVILPHLRKFFKGKTYVPGYAVYADKALIEQSAKQLRDLANKMSFNTVILPFPGIGAGGLSPSEVLDLLEKYFDSRFILCFK